VQRNGPLEPCGGECRPLVVERNRYFTGKYMTARDFAVEQEYFLGRHRLHTRLLHGWGVACGLGVTRHPDRECKDWVVVGPGIAIDCCGRELILTERTPFRVDIPESEAKGTSPSSRSTPMSTPSRTRSRSRRPTGRRATCSAPCTARTRSNRSR